MPYGGDIRAQLRAKVEILPLGKHRDAVIADRACDDELIPGLQTTVPYRLLNKTDPCGIDEYFIKRALLNDFGITGNDRRIYLLSRLIHRCHNPTQIADRKAILHDDRTRKRERRRTHHGKVVDRSGYRQPSDVPSGKEDRLDHVCVCGEHEIATLSQRNSRAVV